MHRGGRRQNTFVIITPTIRPRSLSNTSAASAKGMEGHAYKNRQVVEKREISVLPASNTRLSRPTRTRWQWHHAAIAPKLLATSYGCAAWRTIPGRCNGARESRKFACAAAT
jgi:hypothetical protein